MSDSILRTADFPYPTIAPICPTGNKPTYLTLRPAQLQLNMNAKSVHTYRGGGQFGHLVLTMSPAKYLTQTVIPFVIPVAPTPNPVHAAGATGPAITETNRQHKADQREHAVFIATQNALRSQLLAAVPYKYIQVLEDPDISFANTPVLDILTHLWETYGKITHADLEENVERMKAPWNPDDGVEVLIAQLKLGREYAAAGNDPISETTAVQFGYAIIKQTGKFETACYEWRLKPTAEKTFENFVTKFRLAVDDYSSTATSRSAGYHSANAIANTKVPPKPVVTKPAQAPVPNPRATTGPAPFLSYCWTHGLLRTDGAKHNSQNCEHKAVGHQDNATLTDKMGGTLTPWQRRPANQE
jgi:hypothetical protein